MIKECDFFKQGFMSNSLFELHTLSLSNISATPSIALRIVGIIWYPPLSGWIKVNTDGSTTSPLGLLVWVGFFVTVGVMLKELSLLILGLP